MEPFNCQWCEAHIGDTTDTELIMGGGIFWKTVSMRCVKCRRRNKWNKPKAFSKPNSSLSVEIVSDPIEVAAKIQKSLAEFESTWFTETSEARPRRDAEIDAAEAEADRIAWEKTCQPHDEKMKKAG